MDDIIAVLTEWLRVLPIRDSVLVPLLIFSARVTDVTFGTLRIVFIGRGLKYRAAALGFLEILIWLLALSGIFQNLTSISAYLAYAGGFAVGNFVGLHLEQVMALGLLHVTIITNRDARALIDHLKEHRYGLTSVNALGATGRVRLIIMIIRRRHLEDLRRIVSRFNPNAFMSVQDVRSVTKEVYPSTDLSYPVLQRALGRRKGK